MSAFNQKPGELRQASTRSNGKAIDEWRFTSVFKTEDVSIVKVSMIVDGAGARFVAVCDDLPRQEFESTDIEKLRRVVEEKLQEHSLIKSGAVWENWLEIQVQNSCKVYAERGVAGANWGQSENARGISLSYQPIKRGTHPQMPGRVFTINSNNIAVDFPKAKASGEYDELDPKDIFGMSKSMLSPERQEELKKMSGRERDVQFAYIVDTPKNRAALDHLLRSMDTLGGQMQAFLASSSLEANLEKLSRVVDPLMAALPAPLNDRADATGVRTRTVDKPAQDAATDSEKAAPVRSKPRGMR